MALEDVRVVEASRGWSGAALAGRLLGELGAEVVKLEPPAGDPLRGEGPLAADGVGLAFHLVAATKRSVAVEGRPDADRRAATALLGWGDILLADESGVGWLRSLGVEMASAPARWPHLVAAGVTPFGLRGPLAGWHAGELAVEAMSGVMACTGFPDRPPTRAGVSIGAHFGGLMSAAAVLAALRGRDRGGAGQLVDMSVHDCLVACLGTFLPTYFLTGTPPGRQGNRHTMGAPWNAYRCLDGWIILCAINDSQWPPVLDMIGRRDLIGAPRYATMEARVARVGEVDALIEGWTAGRPSADVLAAADAAGLPAGPIVGTADVLHGAQAHARGWLVEVPGTDGRPVVTRGPLCRMSVTPGRVTRGAPALGEATDDVLRRAAEAPRPAPAGGGSAPPLGGVRVLEMGSFTAGPFVTRLLASLGADVVKIEPPRGEPSRHLAQRVGGDGYLFHVNNTDKRSVVLDTAAAADRKRFLALAVRSDAFVENFAPGTAAGWGLGPDAVLAANPRLLYCSITGFGHLGPLAPRRAFDSVIQAMAGVLTLTGEPEDPPVKVGLSVADLAGPSLAAVALLAALRHRDRHGRGQHLDVSMHDVTGWLTAEAWPAVLGGGASPPRTGNRHPRHVPHGLYRGADDRLLVIEVRDDEEWQRLCGAIGRAALGDDERYATAAGRRSRAAEVEALVAAWVAGRPADAALATLQAAAVASGPVLSLGEVAEHPHAAAREMMLTRDHPTLGPLRLLGSPLALTAPPARVSRPAPALGEHTGEVLGELAATAPPVCPARRQ